MAYKIGIDVGGTFTDFIVTRDGAEPRIHKMLSTPADPSIAVVEGLAEIAAALGQAPAEFAGAIDAIVHGTTVTTNATLTSRGAKTGPAHHARRARRARDAARHPRGAVQQPLHERAAAGAALPARRRRRAARLRRARARRRWRSTTCAQRSSSSSARSVEAVAICFMNAFANPAHEQRAAELVRARAAGRLPLGLVRPAAGDPLLRPGLAPPRSTPTSGPMLDRYLDQLVARLDGQRASAASC